MTAPGYYMGIPNVTNEQHAASIIGAADREHLNDGERLYFVNHNWMRVAVMAESTHDAQMIVRAILSPSENVDNVLAWMHNFGWWWNRTVEKAGTRT